MPPFHYVTTPDARDAAITALSGAPAIGVDIEGASLHRYQDRVSLIQISDASTHFIFDPLVLDSILPFAALFENRAIMKIFHGADYDLLSLKRDFGFAIGPVFDTALAARAVGIAAFSLQNLVERYFHITLPKTHQKSDWSHRPLSEAQLEYAANDTARLVRLYEILKEEVAQKGRGDQLEEECLRLEQITWSDRASDPDAHLRIKGARALTSQARRVLKALTAARNQIAQTRDVPTFKILSNDDLLAMSKQAPRSHDDLARLFSRPRSIIAHHADLWLAAVAEGLAAPAPVPPPKPPSRAPPTPEQEKLLTQMIDWRNQQAAAEGVEQAMVVTSHALREIVREDVQCTADLTPMLRQWQIRRYGAALMHMRSEWGRRPAS